MATIISYTAERMLAIENGTVVSGEIVGNDLILTKYGGGTVNAGNVRGPEGPEGDAGDTGPRGTKVWNTDSTIDDISDIPGVLVDDLIFNSHATDNFMILDEITSPGNLVRVLSSTTGELAGTFKGPMGPEGPAGAISSPPVYTTFGAFPASPAEGEEAILQTTVMKGSGVAWKFRYMAGVTGTRKWIFQGGARVETAVLGLMTYATATTVTALTSGPALVVPATGLYNVGISGYIQGAAAGSCIKRLMAKVGSGGTTLAQIFYQSTTNGDAIQCTNIGFQAALTEGDVVSCFTTLNAAVSSTFGEAQLTIEPVRLGS